MSVSLHAVPGLQDHQTVSMGMSRGPRLLRPMDRIFTIMSERRLVSTEAPNALKKRRMCSAVPSECFVPGS
jgi:hypothetical protein